MLMYQGWLFVTVTDLVNRRDFTGEACGKIGAIHSEYPDTFVQEGCTDMTGATARNQNWLVALRAQAQEYLAEIMNVFHTPPEDGRRAESTTTPCEAIFHELTSQRFGHLSRRRCLPYKAHVLAAIKSCVDAGKPVRFFYDIGPGYHASLKPGELDCQFDVGLAELLAVRQARLFGAAVERVYPPGARFSLVIDNLCGFFTNDAPLELSERYVSRFRQLLRELAVEDQISLLVESERLSIPEYDRLTKSQQALRSNATPDVTEADIENVARFTGRRCNAEEAAAHMARYHRATYATESLLQPLIDGVRLTQRASPDTLGFRAFPGADQRIQVGEVVLTRSSKNRLRPMLLTSRNFSRYSTVQLDVTGTLPSPLPQIRYAFSPTQT